VKKDDRLASAGFVDHHAPGRRLQGPADESVVQEVVGRVDQRRAALAGDDGGGGGDNGGAKDD